MRDKMKFPHYGQVLVFPWDISHLQADHPDIYNRAFSETVEDQNPSPSVLSEDLITQMRYLVPGRKTRASMTCVAVHRPSKRQKHMAKLMDEDELPGLTFARATQHRHLEHSAAQHVDITSAVARQMAMPAMPALEDGSLADAPKEKLMPLTLPKAVEAEAPSTAAETDADPNLMRPGSGIAATLTAVESLVQKKTQRVAKSDKKDPPNRKIKKSRKDVPATSKGNGGPNITPYLRAAMPFPGKPKNNKPVPPMEYKEFKVYTDSKGGIWRVKQKGERKDRAANYKTDAKQGWEKVLSILAEQL